VRLQTSPVSPLASYCRPGPTDAENSLRGRLQPFETVQQSVNAGSVPFADTCRGYLSLVQLASDGHAGDKARFPKSMNCWAQGRSSHVRGPLERQSIAALAGRNQAQA